MAKKQRFPSSANPNKAAASKAAAGPLPEAVSAKKQDCVQVEYKKDNNHILGIGAHALGKGVNTLPAHVWEDAKKHPSVQKLIADGHAVEVGGAKQAKVQEQEDESDDSEESEESDDAPESKPESEDKEGE